MLPETGHAAGFCAAKIMTLLSADSFSMFPGKITELDVHMAVEQSISHMVPDNPFHGLIVVFVRSVHLP